MRVKKCKGNIEIKNDKQTNVLFSFINDWCFSKKSIKEYLHQIINLKEVQLIYNKYLDIYKKYFNNLFHYPKCDTREIAKVDDNMLENSVWDLHDNGLLESFDILMSLIIKDCTKTI